MHMLLSSSTWAFCRFAFCQRYRRPGERLTRRGQSNGGDDVLSEDTRRRRNTSVREKHRRAASHNLQQHTDAARVAHRFEFSDQFGKWPRNDAHLLTRHEIGKPSERSAVVAA